MITIKSWFLEKNFDSNSKYGIETSELAIIKETEKAVQITTRNSDFGNITFWCPKSCLMTEADYEVAEKSFEKSCDRFEQLKEFAKSLGIKVTARMKKKTILRNMCQIDRIKAMDLNLITMYECING